MSDGETVGCSVESEPYVRGRTARALSSGQTGPGARRSTVTIPGEIRWMIRSIVMFGLAVVLGTAGVAADEPTADGDLLYTVRHTVAGEEQATRARILVRAADGGLLLETRARQLATVTPDALVSVDAMETPFEPFNADELSAALQQELGGRFNVVQSRRYVIATDAGEAYARWCGRLFERLQTAFLAYWKRAGLQVTPPTSPLVAVIFADPEDFAAYAQAEAGAALAQSQGYYSIRTNRIVLTDLTRAPGQGAVTREAELLRRLETKIANLTTVVHEATHQIAFNCGLHTRYADNPMWLTEGMAMFFEAPDLKSTTGWRTAGRVHPGRLQQFRDYAESRRIRDSLKSLILTDERFRDPQTALDAYAESWALTYFLIREHRRQYVQFLERIAESPRLVWRTPEQREQMFVEIFGTDWESLDREFLRFAGRLRVR